MNTRHLRPALTALGLAIVLAGRAIASSATCTPTAFTTSDGALVVFVAHVDYPATPAAVGWTLTLPAGWSYAAGEGEPEIKPLPGQTGELEWAWIAVPAHALSFTFTLRPPARATATPVFHASALFSDADGTTHTLCLAPIRLAQAL